MTELAVKVSDLYHQYGKAKSPTLAVNGVNLEIPRGRTVGLIGPDGVGKSTMLSVIAGAKILQKGEVLVFGKNIADKKSREELTHKIAFMPQGLGKNLYLTLSIYDNVEFHAKMFGLTAKERKARIARLLKATGLSPFADRPAGKLSGGMKQKLSLCCALVHDPDLLILDEPTTGVDPLSRRQFWQLVNNLRQENPGMTVIVATAYIDEAENFEYVLAMDDGKIIADCPTKQLIADTNSENLEQAYIRTLPEEKRGAVDGLSIPPLQTFPNEAPAIEAHNLTKKFGNFTSVNDVSFTIPKGEIFGFLGSNGCGKSTTMKMLTGLLEPTSGTATLLGQSIDANDINTRKKVGYMTQSFSMYEELTVRENLDLHAKLFQIPKAQWKEYTDNAMKQFDLYDLAEVRPSELPLGIRQRLQLAAACLHKPEVLILDEPTSGVDPAARDMFWEYLIKLSRDDRITIFVTTHFMNEAARCDRISLMHAGRVLAVGSPEELRIGKGCNTLEEAFIRYLEEQADDITAPSDENEVKTAVQNQEKSANTQANPFLNWFDIIWTFASREMKELSRDHIRMFFALFGPVVILLSMASSISFDINPTNFTVLDRDNTQLSRKLIETFEGSSYFIRQNNDIHETHEINPTIQRHISKLVIEIPDGFGEKLLRGQSPEVSLIIDGAYPSTAENLVSSAAGVVNQFNRELMIEDGATINSTSVAEIRMMYNQDFKSIFAMTPGIIMLAMMMIPPMMTALSVVREKEMGTIMNLYGSPATKFQFLFGKQIPYVVIAFASYLLMVATAIFIFKVPIKGSAWAMFLGCFLGVITSTGFGLVVSSITKSQVAAIFSAAIIAIVPTMNFSGMMFPTSRLDGNTLIVSKIFAGSWFQQISLGGFTKGLGFADFTNSYIALIVIYVAYMALATLGLKKQEK
ncbi:ribosome-associated ATPase/putative transporter RbbA [Lonepinella sp. MS14435]|uniref:ribosome-associated ATPase/putative transporter RbbA n=1 Tax=Lonepinella sp. MS14435 TaxID=3003618 RepID=UPI0036DDF98A